MGDQSQTLEIFEKDLKASCLHGLSNAITNVLRNAVVLRYLADTEV